jgi:hypothetical protein
MDEFKEFEAMRSAGIDSLGVYHEASSKGFDQIACIRMLRIVFGLSLVEAAKIAFEGDIGEKHGEKANSLVNEFTKVLDDELGLD